MDISFNLFEIFLFGFGLAISIGPIAIAVINKCLSDGFKAGMLCVVGAGLGDFTFAFISYHFHNSAFYLLNLDIRIIQQFSAFVLIIFGTYLIYTALKFSKIPLTQNNKNSNINILSIYLLTLSNPLSIVAFLALFGHVVLQKYSIGDGLLFSMAIFLGSLLAQSIILLATLGMKYLIRPSLDHQFIVITSNIVSGFLIFCFGLYPIFFVQI